MTKIEIWASYIVNAFWEGHQSSLSAWVQIVGLSSAGSLPSLLHELWGRGAGDPVSAVWKNTLQPHIGQEYYGIIMKLWRERLLPYGSQNTTAPFLYMCIGKGFKARQLRPVVFMIG